MNVKKNVSEKLKQEFHITIKSDDIVRRVTDSLAEKAKTVSMPGFRPGKVPMNVVRQRYEGSIVQDILNYFVQDSSRNILKENKIKAATQPTYTLDSFEYGNDFSFHLHVETLPEVAMPDYSKIKIDKISSTVEEAEIDTFINNQVELKTFFRPAAEKAKPAHDDRVIVSLETRVGKNVIKLFTVKDAIVRIGTKNFLFDFIEDALMTKKVGDTFTVEHAFPADYQHKVLAGKKATFNVTVLSHDNTVKLSLGEEFAKECGFESVEALKTQVRSELQKQTDANIHLYHKRILLDVLAEQYDFDLPISLVKSEFDSIWTRLKAEMDDARKQGLLEAEDDKSDEELTAEYQVIAERRVRLGLVIAEISRNENIRLEDKAIQDIIIQEALKYQGQERQVVDYYRNNPQAVDMLVAPVLEDKVLAFILDKITSKETVLSSVELTKRFTGILPGFEAEEENEKTSKEKASTKAKAVKEEGAKKA